MQMGSVKRLEVFGVQTHLTAFRTGLFKLIENGSAIAVVILTFLLLESYALGTSSFQRRTFILLFWPLDLILSFK